MKTRAARNIFFIVLLGIFSCNEPKTVITDIVHPDGSVTRKIEIKNSERKFELSNVQVPFDSSWKISDSIEIGEKGDTVWVKRAEKLFANVEQINDTYLRDSSANKAIKRHVEFSKKFRWFNTEYRFAEAVDKKMRWGYPVTDFLTREELDFFYSPDFITNAKKTGADSLKYKALADTINKKTDKWFWKNAASEWIGFFSELTKESGDSEISFETLKKRESDFVKILERTDKTFDSLWAKGLIQKEFLGEQGSAKYRKEADSALNLTTGNVIVSFKDYNQRIIMPGRLIGTNGFQDSVHLLLWPVKSDYFLTEPYQMWAESKTTNIWAWIITGIFLLFVLSGLILKVIRK
jgi:hypothetical protein